MEKLEDFRRRIGNFQWNSLTQECLCTSQGLSNKVNAEGNLRPFVGNTVVYQLSEMERDKLSKIQQLLYQEAGTLFSEKLSPDSFHITLHDLLNGLPSEELWKAVKAMDGKAMEMVQAMAAEKKSIRLRSTALFNMVNTSMVLGFEPDSEEDCRILMEYYEWLQVLCPLSYPLTPHVTLAYFRLGEHRGEELRRLRRVVEQVNAEEKIEVQLMADKLQYVHFQDMNHYGIVN